MSDTRDRQRILNTVRRWYGNRGTWPTLERVAREHRGLTATRIVQLIESQPEPVLEVVDGTVRLLAVTSRQDPEDSGVEPSDLGAGAKSPASPDVPEEELLGDDGIPVHLALLYGVQACSRGKPAPDGLPLRLPSFPQAVLGGRSRNMALMTLYLCVAEALRKNDRETLARALTEVGNFVARERDAGLQSQEILSQYATWSTESICLLWRDLQRFAPSLETLGLLEDHLRREVALWRICSLRIVVRNQAARRPRYVGLGCRTAGTRKLPSSIVDFSNGALDPVMCLLIDSPPDVDRWRGRSDSYEDSSGVEAEIVEQLEPLRGLCSDVATVDAAAELLERQHVRTLVPLVVERFRDGAVLTYLEQNASLQTGAVWAVLQHADGVGYDALFPYRDADGRRADRVRRGHPQLGRGKAAVTPTDGADAERLLEVWSTDPATETDLRPAREILRLPPESERVLRVRLDPHDGTTVDRRAQPPTLQ